MEAIGIGIVGTGRVLEIHRPVLEELSGKFRVRGVFDLVRDRAAAAAKKFSYDVPVVDSLQELLEMPSVELVLVLTKPPTTHYQVALKALAAGKHVVVEKPMAQTTDECDEMIEAARRAGRVLTVNQNRRWDNNFNACLKGIKEGKIGRPTFLEVNLGGAIGCFDALLDWGVHLFDQILCLNPSPIVAVTAYAVNPEGKVTETGSTVALIRFQEPPLVLYKFLTGITEAGSEKPRQVLPRFYVVGTEGAFKVDPGEQGPYQHPFYEELWGCLREGKAVPVTPLSARNAIHLIDLVYESIRTGKMVKGDRKFE